MADIVKVLFQLQAQGEQIQTELNKISGGYKNVSEEAQKQNAELSKLAVLEKELLAARAKSNNPTSIALYNAKIKETRSGIKSVSDEIIKQTSTLKNNAKESALSGEALKKAFDASLIKNANGEIIASRANYIKLRTELANNVGTQRAEELAVQLGKVKHELELAGEAARAFGSENKLKESGVLLEDIGASILKLDFRGAASQAKLLADLAKTISFKDVLVSVKQLGETLANVGQALLKNPLFLLVGTILAIVEVTKDLIETDERYNKVLEENEKAIEKIVEATEKLIRANRDLALENEINAGKIGKINGEQLKNQNAFKDAIIDIGKQQREATKKLDDDFTKAREEDGFRQTKNLLESLGVQFDSTKAHLKAKADIQKSFDEQRAELTKKFGLENSKILIDESNDELNIIKKLVADIHSIKDKNELALFDEKTIAGIEKTAEKRIQIARREIALEQKENLKNVIDQNAINTIKSKEAQKLAAEITGINQDTAKKEKEIKKQTLEDNKKLNETVIKDEADLNKALLELQINTAEIESNNQVDSYSGKFKLTNDYYNALISLTKKNSSERILLEAQLDNALLQLDFEHRKEIFKNQNDDIHEQERHDLAINSIKTKNSKIASVNALLIQIQAENDSFKALQENDLATEIETKKHNNKIEELQAQLTKDVLKLKKEQISQTTDFINQDVQATLKAAEQVLSAEIAKTDQLIALQQKRVDEVAKIAENGNAQLLQLEKDRLDKLNKEKEKFVRQQQALAVIELISNTAVTVTKAAAEGGAGAAVTIAAALIALIAGLASARSIAGQAAFYEGGYTGDGNPREQSTLIGNRPYTYHKAEFVHDHITTKKYRDVFEKVHEGKVDLNEWKSKVELYDMLRANKIDINRDVYMKQSSGSSEELYVLKKSMENVVTAIKEQPGMSVHIDDNGIAIITNRYYKNKQRINSIAR